MRVTLRKTVVDDLVFVLEAEHHPENSVFVIPWGRARHEAALVDSAQSHLIIEAARPVGYILLAGLNDPNRNVEFRRIVITQKGKGLGRQAVELAKDLAFEQLGANRLWLDVKEHNQRAQPIVFSVTRITSALFK